MRSGAGVVSDPDTEVLDLCWALLVDLYLIPSVRVCSQEFSASSCRGELERTWLTLTISPLAFLTFRSFIKKYQNRDLATTVLGAKILMRYNLGDGFASVGRWRAITWYSLRRPKNPHCQVPYSPNLRHYNEFIKYSCRRFGRIENLRFS